MRRFEGYRRSQSGWRPNERQRHVLDLLVTGKTNPEIAEALGMTLDGAKWHVGELLAATGCEDRQALASWWRTWQAGRRPGLPWALVPIRFALAAAAISLVLAVILIQGWLSGGGEAGDGLNPEAAADFESVEATPAFQPSYVEGPPPPCDMPLPPDFRIVTRADLLAEGLIESGPSFGGFSECPAFVSNRPDRAVIWFADGGTIANGTTLDAWGLDLTLLRGETRSADGDVQALITIGSHVRRVGPEGVFAVIMAKDENTGRFHRIAFDSDGRMYFSLVSLPEDEANDLRSGGRIETTGMKQLADFDLSARGSFAFSSCEVETPACAVSYHGSVLRAPAAGYLRCLEPDELTYAYESGRPFGEYELDTGDFVLRFRETYAYAPNLRTVFRCEPRVVLAGEQISAHNHFQITARDADGRPASLVATLGGRLYVGAGCPCADGSQR